MFGLICQYPPRALLKKQGQKTQSPAVIGQATPLRPGQEKQQPNDHATGKNDQK
jgi:hypothetical protein